MSSFSLPWPFGGSRGDSEQGKRSRAEKKKLEEEEAYLEEFGVTQQLRDFVKGFTAETFKDFPLQDDDHHRASHPVEGSSPPAANVSKDLTEWQERHATLVLSKVKEISQLRFMLCPRHLKEKQFWRIYFLLVKTFVSPYEIQAIKKAKLRTMELDDKKAAEKAAIEVEMTEATASSSA